MRMCSLLLALTGCGTVSSLPSKGSEPAEKPDADITAAAAQQSVESVEMPFQELIPLLLKEQPRDVERVEPQTWYGIWATDRADTHTLMRIERPLIHVIGIDKKTNASWVMDGHYSVAVNGMMYGVMTALDTLPADPERARALLENDEHVLRGRRGEKKMMPFCCRLRPDGPELTVTDFRGTCLEKDRDRFLHGRYQQTSLGRPSGAVPSAPLGTWVNDSDKQRLTMVLQPGRFELQLFDRISGRRLNLAGNYDVATDGIIFGVINVVEHGELGKAPVKGRIAPQVLCFRFGFHNSVLVIDEVHSLGLEKRTEESLLGDYRPPRPQQNEVRRRGRS